MQCLSSKYVLHKLINENPLSMLITSGTLSPIDTIKEQLGVYFKETLSNKHVIGSSSVLPIILKRGIKGSPFNFSFA
jgi:regulator of telomere elongation helicase 1